MAKNRFHEHTCRIKQGEALQSAHITFQALLLLLPTMKSVYVSKFKRNVFQITYSEKEARLA
jgi:hypothetical protein